MALAMFQDIKIVLIDGTGLGKDALHIYVSLAVFFGSCLWFGWRAWNIGPLLMVAAAAILGELWDISDSFKYDAAIDPAGHVKDLVNTMLVPTIITLVARYSPLFRRSNEDTDMAEPAAADD